MAYTQPVYNIPSNIWLCSIPSAAAPDYEDYLCQKYIASKMFLDATPPAVDFWWYNWVPPVQLRYPRSAPPFNTPWPTWTAMCFEVPSGSGQYYRSLWRDVQHEGFVNEYALIVAVQCDVDGKAVVPPGYADNIGVTSDPCSPPPPPPPPPPTAYYSDSFSDTAGTAITAHVPDVGSGTYAETGTWLIDASGIGVAFQVGSGTPPCWTYISTDGSHADGTMTAIVVIGSGADIFGIIARASAGINGYLAYCDVAAGQFQLYKAVANVYTAIGGLVSGLTYPSPGTTITVKLIIVGNSITADLNITGTHSTSSATDSTWTTQSDVGLWSVTGQLFIYADWTA